MSGWVDYIETESNQQATAVRIVPNQSYEIDWTGINLRVDGNNILSEDIKANLASDTGYTLTSGIAYALEDVEFKISGGGNGNSGNGGGGEPGSRVREALMSLIIRIVLPQL